MKPLRKPGDLVYLDSNWGSVVGFRKLEHISHTNIALVRFSPGFAMLVQGPKMGRYEHAGAFYLLLTSAGLLWVATYYIFVVAQDVT